MRTKNLIITGVRVGEIEVKASMNDMRSPTCTVTERYAAIIVVIVISGASSYSEKYTKPLIFDMGELYRE